MIITLMLLLSWLSPHIFDNEIATASSILIEKTDGVLLAVSSTLTSILQPSPCHLEIEVALVKLFTFYVNTFHQKGLL